MIVIDLDKVKKIKYEAINKDYNEKLNSLYLARTKLLAQNASTTNIDSAISSLNEKWKAEILEVSKLGNS